MFREAHEDTTLDIPNPNGQEGTTTIPIPKGTQARYTISPKLISTHLSF